MIDQEQRARLEQAYFDAHTLEDTSGKHWILMAVLAELGRPVNSRQEALRAAEEILYGLSSEDEHYLVMADEV
jgi:hypothetical protein